MDLKSLRSMDWMAVWRRVAETNLRLLRSTALADQDIFNAVIKEKPGLVHVISCAFNLQLGDRTNIELCQSDISDLKIIHWNSPNKINVKNKYASFFKRHYQTFLEMDGNLLRRELLRCPNASSLTGTTETAQTEIHGTEADYEDDECFEFRRAQRIQYRTHIYFSEFSYTPKAADVTLVAQLSMDRLQMLVGLLEHWDGPASIAVYLSDAEAYQLTSFLQETSVLSRRKDVAYHVVYKEGSFYPVNYLRNVALENAATDYVYLSDIDFLPMYGLYETLRQAIVGQGSMDRKALVVPAFETQRYRFEFPKSKAELVNMLDTGQLFVFRQDVWAKGHVATDYDKWRTAAAPYSVGWRPDFEPYIVVSRRQVPGYDTRFLGFGWNKSSFIMELDALGFDFVVLPSAFMIHLPHSPSIDILKYRGSPAYRRCLKIIKGEFVKALSKKYSRRVVVANNTRTASE